MYSKMTTLWMRNYDNTRTMTVIEAYITMAVSLMECISRMDSWTVTSVGTSTIQNNIVNIKQHSACLIYKPIKVNSNAALISCIAMFLATDSMTGLTYEPRYEKIVFFFICENKDADQLRGNREADQRLCFRYTDSTIPLLPKSEISSL